MAHAYMLQQVGLATHCTAVQRQWPMAAIQVDSAQGCCMHACETLSNRVGRFCLRAYAVRLQVLQSVCVCVLQRARACTRVWERVGVCVREHKMCLAYAACLHP